MKSLALLLLLIALTFAVLPPQQQNEEEIADDEDDDEDDEEEPEDCNSPKLLQSKSYSSSGEASYRRWLAQKRCEEINEYNNDPNHTSKKKMNSRFGDLTDEELRATYLNLAPFRNKQANVSFPKLSSSDLHSSDDIDWVAAKKVTPIKDQGSCGSCWAFSAIGTVESAILLKKTHKKHTKFDLSEQQQVECAKDNYNGCNGGWMDWTYDYSIEKGLQNERKYKYTGNYNGCSKEGGKWKISSYKNIQASFSAVVSALKEQPLSVAVDATNWFFNGASIIPYSYERQLNHAVILVGYFNGGCNEESQPYWRIKNSWGTDWADEGYANLAVGDDGNTFGIMEEVQQPIY